MAMRYPMRRRVLGAPLRRMLRTLFQIGTVILGQIYPSNLSMRAGILLISC